MPPKTSTARKSAAQKAITKRIQTAKGKWNLMFYIAGDEGLSASMISQLKELTDAGFQRDTRVLVYFDPNCNGRAARIYDVNNRRKTESKEKTFIGDGDDPFVRSIAEDCRIQDLPQMPAAITLRYFLEYSRVYYPAENYMLFLMGHGVIVGGDAFLPDPDDNSAISMVDLGWILQKFASDVRRVGEDFHVVGFHSCSMSSVELAYQLAGSARYMIGTQGGAFPGSWPYRQLLKKIFNVIEKNEHPLPENPKAGHDKIVPEVLRGLQNLSFYNSEDFWLAGYSADLSLCSLDQERVGDLTKPLNNLSRALQNGLSDKDGEATNCIQLAHVESQSYWNETYTDLYDFCSCLAQRCKGKTASQVAIKRACNAVTKVLASRRVGGSGRLVLHSDFYGPWYQFSNGLSIYFPWRSPTEPVLQAYSSYKLNQEGGEDSWLSFLLQYFKKTMRSVNGSRVGPPPIEKRAQVFSPLAQAQPDLLRTMPVSELLAKGPTPADREGDIVPEVDEAMVGALANGPGKVGDLANGPGKVGDLANGPGKVGDLANGPGKVGDLANGPGKVGDLANGPGKVGDLASGPGKVGDLANGPGKVGDLGLFFGHTIIKNFAVPPGNRFVTSRRNKFSHDRLQGRTSKKAASKRDKSAKRK